jgi:predicted phage terminase large subunit-like protein
LNWFKFYDTLPKDDKNFIRTYSWDFSFKDHKNSDFVVGQVWNYYPETKEHYLVHQVRDRLSFANSKKAIYDMFMLYGHGNVLVEDKANGSAIIQELKNILAVTSITPKESKYARAEACTGYFSLGKILLPKSPRWLEEYMKEHQMFPNSKYDDQVDCTSQYLNYMSMQKQTNQHDLKHTKVTLRKTHNPKNRRYI